MSQTIWNYPTTTVAIPVLRAAFEQKRCPCCQTVSLSCSEGSERGDGRFHTEFDGVDVCSTCGWWLASRYFCHTEDCRSSLVEEADLRVTASGAALEKYGEFDDPSTLALLQGEVEKHLKRHGTSQLWAAMEDATLAILRSFGYQARPTARSKDGGVDIILDGGSRGTVFIQVKHSRNTVGVSVFRELVGTMSIDRVRAGLLLTSSRFTEPTKALAKRAEAEGIVVELVDGQRFLAALNLSARLRPPTLEEIAAIAEPGVVLRSERIQL
jgi:hypothetical protein